MRNSFTIGLACVILVAATASGDWEAFSDPGLRQPVLLKDDAAGALSAQGKGSLSVNGGWQQTIAVEAGRYYRFVATFDATDVAVPRRSVLMKIVWCNADNERIGLPSFPRTRELMGTPPVAVRGTIDDACRAPPGAVSARMQLILRWAAKGSVRWADVSAQPVDAPAPRRAKFATVDFRPRSFVSCQDNREKFARLAEEAGARGADVVVLPEGMVIIGGTETYRDAAEPIPGPTTQIMGAVAAKHHMYVVAPLYERAIDGTVYNSAVLLDRQGKIVGTYRKVSLPVGEVEGGLTPGDDFPVFETDFGKVGILICWDLQFPEGARRLAAQGADVILLPIWGGFETLMPARAQENCAVLVSSSFDSKCGIWDRFGKLRASADDPAGSIALAEIDLNDRQGMLPLGSISWPATDLVEYGPRQAPEVREAKGN